MVTTSSHSLDFEFRYFLPISVTFNIYFFLSLLYFDNLLASPKLNDGN